MTRDELITQLNALKKPDGLSDKAKAKYLEDLENTVTAIFTSTNQIIHAKDNATNLKYKPTEPEKFEAGVRALENKVLYLMDKHEKQHRGFKGFFRHSSSNFVTSINTHKDYEYHHALIGILKKIYDENPNFKPNAKIKKVADQLTARVVKPELDIKNIFEMKKR